MRNFRPALRRTMVSLAVAGLAAVSIAACDGGDSGSTAGAAPAAKATAEAAAGKAVSAKELCGYLKKNVGEWKAVGSEVGAMAQMTMGLAEFYDGKGTVPDGIDLDEKSKAECPDVRAEVLEAAGIDTFTAL